MSGPKLHRRAFLGAGLGLSAAWFCRGSFLFRTPATQLNTIHDSLIAMGTRVSFVVRHPDPRWARMAIEEAMGVVLNVHAAMTLHDESPLTHLNRRAAGQVVEVPRSVLDVLLASTTVHSLSDGAFDPTIKSDAAGMSDLEIDVVNRTVEYHRPGLSIDLNGIAKGYAVDLASEHLRSLGVEHFIVNAGGDLYVAGDSGDGEPGWQVHLSSDPSVGWRLSDRAVATSGNGNRSRDVDGRRVPHLIDPRTGGATDQYRSSTVVADRVMEADAWSTALFVGERTQMLRCIDKVPGMSVHFASRST